MPVALTVFDVPMSLSANVAVPLIDNVSPATRLSPYVTDAVVSASYVLFEAVIVTASARAVMLAVVVVDVFQV